VYEIEHIATGKKYIGSRTAKNCNPDELLIMEGYLTSSKIVNEIIQKEGNSAFKVNWIECCSDKNQAIELETVNLLKIDAANNSEYFNLHNNDGVMHLQKLCEFHGVDNVSQIPEVALKIRDSKIGENNPMYGKNGEKSPMWGKRGMLSPNWGRIHTKDAILLISESKLKYYEEHPEAIEERSKRMIKFYEDNPEVKEKRANELRRRREDAPNYMKGENNPMYGKPHSKETKLKQSAVAKNRIKLACPHCGKECDPGNAKRHHFDNCKSKQDKL
jgi:hypothetical protein